jgi:hypothetical protein
VAVEAEDKTKARSCLVKHIIQIKRIAEMFKWSKYGVYSPGILMRL